MCDRYNDRERNLLRLRSEGRDIRNSNDVDNRFRKKPVPEKSKAVELLDLSA